MARGGIGRTALAGAAALVVLFLLALWLVKFVLKLFAFFLLVAVLGGAALWLTGRIRATLDRNRRPLPRHSRR